MADPVAKPKRCPTWFVNGMDVGKVRPARSASDEVVYYEWRNEAGLRDHKGSPACREWTVVEGVYRHTRDEWYKDGVLHRPDGPAIESWWIHLESALRTKRERKWYTHGKLDRVGGPAFLEWEEGVLVCRGWYRNGERIPPHMIKVCVTRIIRFMKACIGNRVKRKQAVAESIWEAGGIVWPGLLDLILPCK